MSETKKELKLQFKRADDGTFTMTVPDYKPALTDTEVKTAGATIVEQGAFEPDGFALTALVEAYKIDTTTTPVDLSV